MKLRWNWIHIFHTIHQSDKFFSFYILSFLLHWSLFWMRSIYELNVCLKIKFWISSKNCPRILKKTTSVCENQGKISDKKIRVYIKWHFHTNVKTYQSLEKREIKDLSQTNPSIKSIINMILEQIFSYYCHLIWNSTPSRRSRR